MVDFILNFSVIDMAVFGIVLFLVLLVAWSALAADRRAKQLSAKDPPTPEELREAEELRLAGPFRMRGPSSAAARHFENDRWQVDRSSGGPGCYEPPFVGSWRDQRSQS